MEQYLENRVSAWDAALLTLERNRTMWKGYRPFERAVDEITNIREQVRTAVQRQSEQSKGATAGKEAKRDMMEKQMLTLSRRAHVYAQDEKNYELEAMTDMSASSLYKMADTVVAERGAKLAADLQPLLSNLKDYRVTETMIRELSDTVAVYRADIGKPSMVIAGGKTATASIETLVRDGQNLFKRRLDKLVRTFDDEHPDFVADYFNARVVRDNGRRKDGPDSGQPQ